MTTIRLSAGSLIACDGEIVEFFWGSQSQRAHVGVINKIQAENRKGKNWFVRITSNLRPGENMPGGLMSDTFDDRVLPEVNEMITEIQKAMSTYRANNE